MITVSRQIPDYAHMGNPMLLYVSTDNMVQSAGSFAEFRIVLDTTATSLAVDETITLELLNTTLVFTAKTAPDQSGTQVNLRQIGDSDQQYMQRLAEDMSSNYLLNKHYRFEVTTLGGLWLIIFTARKKGSLYSLDSFAESTSIFSSTDTAGTDASNRPAFKLSCTTWYFGPSGFPEVLGEDRITPDATGNAVFDISAWWRGIINHEFQFPMVNAAIIRPRMSQPYYNTLAEVYGDTPVVQKVQTLAPKTVICGALEREEFEQRYRSYELYPVSQESLFITEKDVLHNRPYRIYARLKLDNEKLYYISSRAHTLKMKVFFTDGTDQTVNLWTLPFNPNYPIVIEANVSPWFLQVENVDPSKTVKYYRLFANSPAQPTVNLFNPVDIHIDKRSIQRRREFMFRNRRGAFEFIRFTGIFERVKPVSFQDYARAGSHDNPFEINKYGRFNIESEPQINGNTGPLNRLEWLHIREFFESPEVYENVGGRLYGIRMQSTEYDSFRDNTFERGVGFTYSRHEEPAFFFDGKCPSGPEIVIVNQQTPIENLVTR